MLSLLNGPTIYDERHGGPFDRGDSDAHFERRQSPHYYKGGSYESERVEMAQMTPAEVTAYNAGFDLNPSGVKDWS